MRAHLLALAAAVSLAVAGPAAAAELLVISLLPGSSQWYVNGRMAGTVDPDAYSVIPMTAGVATLQVMDENADGQTRQVTFDPANLATSGSRSFWCVGGRTDEATGRPKIVVMPRPNCQKFLEGRF